MELINPHRMFQGVFIPNALMKYKRVSQSAKLMWGRLAQYAGKDGRCYPDFQELADEIGLSESGARKVMKELRDEKFIWIKYPTGKERLMHRRCEYFFIYHEIFKPTRTVFSGLPENGQSGMTGEGHSGIPETGECKEYPKTGSATEENHIRESLEEISMSETISDAGSQKKQKFHGTDEDHQLARKIYDAVLVVNATVKEPNWNRWANSIRLMREQDKRTHEEIWHVFDYANRDPFWSNNVLSPDSLRKQFSRLAPRAGIVRSPVEGGGHGSRSAEPERKCSDCEWVNSNKWFCRAKGNGECSVCDNFRAVEGE